MASHDQARRKKQNEMGEKKSVPQVSRQIESLTVSSAELHQAADLGGETGNVGKFEMQGGEGEAEDIAKYRQAAQQNSIDAVRAAEERYNKAKQVASSETSAQAKDTSKKGAQRNSKGQPMYETTRDTLKTAADYTGQAKDYVSEKAVGAKDVVAETGKGTAGYVGSVAATVKDKAVVAGWGAGEYTAEKAADATKAVANLTAGAAGYVGDTTVAAKDKVGSVGVSAKDYATQNLGAAKDAVVATQESAKDFAARKRAEAEARHDDIPGAGRRTETISEPPVEEEVGGYSQAQPEYGHEGQQGGEAQRASGGVLQAIGETVIGIGQTTKDFLVGKGHTQSADRNR